MNSIRDILCAAILAVTSTGCGGSTNAETVSPADGEHTTLEAKEASSESADAPVETASPVLDVDTDSPLAEAQTPREPKASDETQSPAKAEADAGEEERTEAPVENSAIQSADPPATDIVSKAEELVVGLQQRTVLDGAVSLEVPTAFHVMSREKREQRYAAGQRPSLVLTNSASDVNIAFNLTPNEMTPEQLSDFQRQMASLFRSQVARDHWIGSSTTRINGLDWFTIEMRTEAFGTKIWNLIAGTSLNGRLLLVSFNSTTEQEVAWKPFCRQMLQSVKLAAEPLNQPELSAAK